MAVRKGLCYIPELNEQCHLLFHLENSKFGFKDISKALNSFDFKYLLCLIAVGYLS